jgi:polysaccharide biosynthesis transport protein
MHMNDRETSELRLYSNLFWRRRYDFLLTVPLVLLAMGLYTLQQPKIYESSVLLLVGRQQKPQIVTSDETSSPKPDSQELDTEVQLLQTLPLISQATNILRPIYPNLDPQIVVSHLKVQQIGKAGVISVVYQDTDPQRLVSVLSQLSKTYVDFSLTNRRSQVTSAIQFIEQKLPEARKTLAAGSQQLADFRKRNQLVDPDDTGTTVLKSLADLDAQTQATVAAVSQEQERYNTLRQQLDFAPPKQALATASLSQDAVYLELLKNYQEAENLYRLDQIRFTDSSPQVQALKAKRDELNQLLKERMKRLQGEGSADANPANPQQFNELQITQVAQLLESQNNLKVQQARLAALQAARPSLEQNLSLVPGLKQQYESLLNRVQTSSNNLALLSSRLEEFRILEAQETPNWQIIQPPAPPSKPISPNLKLNLMIGSVLALLLGLLVALAHEQLDRRLRSVESVNELLKLRTLSVIPKIHKKLLSRNGLAPGTNHFGLRSQWFTFQAAIQHLLFNLRSLGERKTLQAIGFTSSTSQEGKSSIVRHLGICAAEMGRQVLLIDGDLRKPQLHLGLNIPNQLGLSNIVNEQIPWGEVVQSTAYPGLSVLTAGPAPANSVALLDSAKMRQLMAQLRDHYDLIIMDLPPVIGLTDSLAAAQCLDGLVFVVALDRTKTNALKLSLEALGSHPPIGVVCNLSEQVDMKHLAAYMGNQNSSHARLNSVPDYRVRN